ncbi:MAG TPA: ABC transporter permease [Mycobacteriales bacterium]
MTETLSDAGGAPLPDTHDMGGAPLVGEIAGRSPTRLALSRLRHDRVAMISGVVIVLLVLLAICAPLVAHLTGHGDTESFRHGSGAALSPENIPVGPNHNFLLGGDDQGRDLLVRLAYGARVSLAVGVLGTLASLVIGTVVGIIAGFYGGWVDTFISRIVDIFLSYPIILFAEALAAVFQPSLTLVFVVVIIFGWTVFARIARGQVLSVREREFVEASRALGARGFRIMFIDMLPNLVAPLIVYYTLTIPVNIVFEATLSFLGIGVKPPTASWGQTLSAAQVGGLYLVRPTFLIFPMILLFITTLSFNLFGDGVRDAFDPRAARTMAK